MDRLLKLISLVILCNVQKWCYFAQAKIFVIPETPCYATRCLTILLSNPLHTRSYSESDAVFFLSSLATSRVSAFASLPLSASPSPVD